MCQSKKNTAEHVLERNKGEKKFNLNDDETGKNGERQ